MTQLSARTTYSMLYLKGLFKSYLEKNIDYTLSLILLLVHECELFLHFPDAQDS